MKMMRTLLTTAMMAAVATSAQAEMTDGKLKIGVLADMGSVYADICGQGCVTAVQMAVDDFGGKVNGVPVEIVSADDQNKPDVGANIVRQWLDVDQVDLVAGLVSSGVSIAANKVITEKDKVGIVSGSAADSITNEHCSPNIAHWTYDTQALANGTAKAIVDSGKKNWFFITADYAFGHALEAAVTKVVSENGGNIVGSVKVPLGTTDFSSYILQAQSSGAEVIGMANAGADTVNTVKSAAEFGITESGQDLAGLLLFLPNVKAIGLDKAGGLKLTTGFYWDMDEQTREWSKRFMEKAGVQPSMIHAGAYSSTMHYLKAVQELGSDADSKAVMAKMREMKIEDFFSRNAYLREDGRMIHDMYLVQVKTPKESQNEWDLYKVLSTIPGDEAYRKPADSSCPLLKKS